MVLAGGVALYATNIYLTASLLPSAVRDIGGDRFFAWATTIFLVASVCSAVLVNRLLVLAGNRVAYLTSIAIFTAGTVVCGLAPEMWVLLPGRAVQGAGGTEEGFNTHGTLTTGPPPPHRTRARART